MEKKAKIKPEILGGFNDFLPELMIPRQEIISKIRQTFESFGFLPLDTPAIERSSVLGTDVDEFKMEVYRFMAGEQDVTLRFDLTVPLSRVVAAYPGITKPFKRYQIGSVWRREKPQAGRYREFMQFDADIVGSDSIFSDTEIIVLMYNTLLNLEVENFVIRFNNRKILNGISQVAKFDQAKAMDVFRVLDKLEKIGKEEVVRELQRVPDNEWDETALNLSDESVAKIDEFLALAADRNDIFNKLRLFFAGVQISEEGIDECEAIVNNLEYLQIPQNCWMLDLSVARGLGYYTGPVFETTLNDIPEIGSVFSGGRFDDLIMRYTGERIPAVGASVGVDRLIAALGKLGKIKSKKSVSRVLIAILSEQLGPEMFGLAQKMRAMGINTEVYLGREKGLRSQIIYAAKKEIPFVVIIGEEEKEAGKLKLKDMQSREELLLTEKELFARLSA